MCLSEQSPIRQLLERLVGIEMQCPEREHPLAGFPTCKSQPQKAEDSTLLSVCNCWDFPYSWIFDKTNPGPRHDYQVRQLWGGTCM